MIKQNLPDIFPLPHFPITPAKFFSKAGKEKFFSPEGGIGFSLCKNYSLPRKTRPLNK
jgi:hypothetical protein